MKKLSNRKLFKQLLLQDVLTAIKETEGTYIAVADLKNKLDNSISNVFYSNNLGNVGYSYTSWADRFYRQLQSIHDGENLTIVKVDNKLYAFDSSATKTFKSMLLEGIATVWTKNYNR
jgi:hypothetical protein